MAAEPDWNPDTGGRSLAEILREAGIEAPKSVRRRARWEETGDTGIRQRGSGGAPPEGRPSYGRRLSDVELAEPAPARERRRPAPEPSTAAIPGLRPERTPGVPTTSGPVTAAPVRQRKATERRPAERPEDRPERRAERPERRAARPERGGEKKRTPAKVHEEDFSTGPIPVVRAEDIQDDATPRESALAWLRFAGELVIALAAGVGIYFMFNVLWENLPYVAVLLAPFAVTALVGGVTFWRQRMGHEPVGPKLLVVLVFAGTLLTIVPAAQLLNPA